MSLAEFIQLLISWYVLL